MTRTPDLNAAGPRVRDSAAARLGPRSAFRRGVLLIPLLVTAVPLLSACDAAIGLYRDVTGASKNDPGPDEPNSDALAGGSSQSFPNLASVPAPPKPALSAEQRDRLSRGLIADRANAVHIDQQIRAGTDISLAGPAPRMGPVLEAATLPGLTPGGAATAVTPGIAAPPAPSPPPAPAAATPATSTYVSPLGSTETIPASPPVRAPRAAAPLPQSLPDLPAPDAPPATPSPEMAWAPPAITMQSRLQGQSAPPPDAAAAGGTSVATIPAQPGTSVEAPPPEADTAPPPPRRETALLSPDVRERPGAEIPQPPPAPPALAPTPGSTPVPIPAAGQVQPAPASPGLVQGATPDSPPPGVAPGGALSKTPRSTNSILLGQVDANSVDKKLIGDVAQLQKEHGATIRLIGHAARGQGADAANQQLTGYQAALGRANVIASALTDAGVPTNKIVVEAAPARNGAAAGDVLNRTDVYAEY